ncbi:MAG: Pr6Pr family membrane protein [Firmicutes bacterium]|nr:Pr6Pr family membrane protein [Bacillota bacterium]
MPLKNRLPAMLYRLALLAAVTAGLYLTMFGHGEGFNALSLRYFTIQSNILVALALLYFLLSPENGRIRIIVRGSVLLSIIITGLVFHTLLVPQFGELFGGGIDLSGHLTHTIAPVGFLLDWLLFERKGLMQPADLPFWTLYPLLYWLFSIWQGAETGFYPYFFMDVSTLGYGGALLWLAALSAFFLIIGLLLLGIDRLLARPAGQR